MSCAAYTEAEDKNTREGSGSLLLLLLILLLFEASKMDSKGELASLMVFFFFVFGARVLGYDKNMSCFRIICNLSCGI